MSLQVHDICMIIKICKLHIKNQVEKGKTNILQLI